jgi:hypothetical protein
MKYLLITEWFIIAGLCIFDNYSTYLILQNGGVEINPIMRGLMDIVGVENALTFSKLIWLLLLLFVIYRMIKKPLPNNRMVFVITSLFLLIGYYTIIMYFFNLQCMIQLKSI